MLFPTAKVTEATIEAVENYYLTWWNGPLTVKVFLHVVVSTDGLASETGERRLLKGCALTGLRSSTQVFILFMSLVCKFARKSETAYYFSGASLGEC